MAGVKKVAIYIRVSTIHQVDKDSLPMQRQDLEAYSRLILGIDDFEFFEDAGYSGKNTDRPAYQDMMERVRRGEFSHVLVWKIDRISRNLLDFASMYSELQKLRVTFVSKNEQFDTSTAIGEAMLKIILVFAELERNMTSERVSATMISRASNGIWNGGRVPYGYDYDAETGAFTINEAEAEACRFILSDYLYNTQSVEMTSRNANAKGYRHRSGSVWSPNTVDMILRSPFYIGTYRYNRYKGAENRTTNPRDKWVFAPNHHPAIFSVEEYDAAQKILDAHALEKNAPGRRVRRKYVFPLAGLVYCGKCGSKMVTLPTKVLADGRPTANYSCPVRRSTHNCTNSSVTDTIVGEFVLNYVLNILNSKTAFSGFKSPADLERRLLFGKPFDEVAHVDSEGLNELYNLFSRYGSDDSYVFSTRRPKAKKAAIGPNIEALRKEKEKQERALRRLQDLYLYSADSMGENEFIVKKAEIVAKIEEINARLGMASGSVETTLSDEEFIQQASHLLIANELKGKSYINYRSFFLSVSPDVLHGYLHAIIDSVYAVGRCVTCIVFKNGMTHRFSYTSKKPAED